MSFKKRMVVWFMLMPAGYWIGAQLEYSIWALLVAMAYLLLAAHLLFWKEIKQSLVTEKKMDDQ